LEGHRPFLDHYLIVDAESFGNGFDRPAHDRVEFNGVGYGNRERFREDVLIVSHVDEGVLVVTQLVLALNEGHKLPHDLTSDHGVGSDHRGDHLTDPHLSLDERAFIDSVIARSNVSSRMDEVHVEV